MSRWTAILAVAGGLMGSAGFAQQQVAEAKASFERALSLVANPAERKLLEERLAAVEAELKR